MLWVCCYPVNVHCFPVVVAAVIALVDYCCQYFVALINNPHSLFPGASCPTTTWAMWPCWATRWAPAPPCSSASPTRRGCGTASQSTPRHSTRRRRTGWQPSGSTSGQLGLKPWLCTSFMLSTDFMSLLPDVQQKIDISFPTKNVIFLYFVLWI